MNYATMMSRDVSLVSSDRGCCLALDLSKHILHSFIQTYRWPSILEAKSVKLKVNTRTLILYYVVEH